MEAPHQCHHLNRNRNFMKIGAFTSVHMLCLLIFSITLLPTEWMQYSIKLFLITPSGPQLYRNRQFDIPLKLVIQRM